MNKFLQFFKKNNQATITTIVCILVLLVAFFSYGKYHAWGSWGGDSGGYILQASKVYGGESLVFKDPIIKKAAEIYDNPRKLKWLLPFRHTVVDFESGIVTSRYPIGFALLYGVAAKIVGNMNALYTLNVLMAAASVALVYLCSVLLSGRKWISHAVGVCAAVAYGASPLVFAYSVAQPMRELPSIVILLSALAIVLFLNRYRKILLNTQLLSSALFIMLGLLLGYSIVIRITNVLPAVSIVCCVLPVFFYCWKELSGKVVLAFFGLVVLGTIVGISPAVIHGVNINQFSNETVSLLDYIAPNSGHSDSLDAQHIVVNEGKFRPEKGAINFYYDELKDATSIPLFFFLVILGAVLLFTKNKWIGFGLFFWIVGLVLFFSAWINPYDRYILPAYPVFILLGFKAIDYIIQQVRVATRGKRDRSILSGAIVFGCILLLYPNAQAAYNYMVHPHPVLKSVSQVDSVQLHAIAEYIEKESSAPAILITSGEAKQGIAAFMEAHYGIRSVRTPFTRVEADYDRDVFFLDELQQNYELFVLTNDSTDSITTAWVDTHDLTSENVFEMQHLLDIHIYKIQ